MLERWINLGKQKPCKYLETEWIWQMTESLARMHPEMDRDTIEDFVIEQYHNRYTNHSAMLHNSYENTTTETSLGEVVDWAESYHPLMAESGVFFYPKDKKRNVNIEIIKEAMLDARTVHKKEKFEAMKRGDTFTAAVKDLQQGNDKKAANSGYGAEGQSSSFLFNVNSAMSVTASGRGQLSTMILNFENLFADNVKFWNMDEFHTYINHVVNDRKSWKFDTDDVINIIPRKSDWVDKFAKKVLHPSLCSVEQIEATYDGLSEEDRIRTFYMSNMQAFLLNRTPMKLFQTIADTDVFINDKGERVTFVNPNEVPKEIADTMDKLTGMIREFVNYKFSNFRYQDKARYSRRDVIKLSDTDSWVKRGVSKSSELTGKLAS